MGLLGLVIFGILSIVGYYWTGALGLLGAYDEPQSLYAAATTTLTVGKTPTRYVKAGEFVYYNGKKVPEADPATFSILGRPRVTRMPDDYYARDKRRVYYNGLPVRFAKPDSFVFLLDRDRNPTDYVKDDKRVYDAYLGVMVKNADPKTFVALNYWYGKDKNAVYGPDPNAYDDTGRFPIRGADPATFEVVADPGLCFEGCPFDAKDKNHKYKRSRMVE